MNKEELKSQVNKLSILGVHLNVDYTILSYAELVGITSKVKTLILPEGIKYIRMSIYTRVYNFQIENLEELTLPSTLVNIEEQSLTQFCNFIPTLKKLSVRNTEYFTRNSVSGAIHLEEIEIAQGTESLCIDAFSSTPKLKRIKLPDSVKILRANCFYSSGVSKVVLNNGLETIGTGVFSACDNLKEIDIPSSVIVINEFAFKHSSIDTLYLRNLELGLATEKTLVTRDIKYAFNFLSCMSKLTTIYTTDVVKMKKILTYIFLQERLETIQVLKIPD